MGDFCVSILDKIANMNDNDLQQLYLNAIEIISKNKPNKSQAKEVLQTISDEWAHRLRECKKGDYKPSYPKEGMLAFLGYHVGQNGTKTKIRHKILDFIIHKDLPLVQSPAYSFEWGGPLSNKRYKKLLRTLKSLSESKEGLSNMEKAIIEWREDIDYIVNQYGELIKWEKLTSTDPWEK